MTKTANRKTPIEQFWDFESQREVDRGWPPLTEQEKRMLVKWTLSSVPDPSSSRHFVNKIKKFFQDRHTTHYEI